MKLDILEICLTSALALCFFVQLYYSLFIHLKLALVKINDDTVQLLKPLSVIICARNQNDKLIKYLPTILNQDYPDFEVVVVNDRSWDGTYELLETLSKQYDRLKVVTVADGDKFIAGKKFAVTMGIKAAKHEWLVFTDADCEPATPNWLKGMQKPANDDIEILLGHAPYIRKRGLLSTLIRFETFFASVNYLSFSLKGVPYKGIGKNMAYQKSLFFKNKGFASHMHISTGEDGLFVNANANRNNTAINIQKEAQVWSEPISSLFAYLKQKKANNTAVNLYKAKHKFLLSLQVIVRFLFYGLAITMLFFAQTLYIAIGFLAFNLVIRSFVYPKLLKRLSYGELRWWFPILDLLLLAFAAFNFILSIFVKKVK